MISVVVTVKMTVAVKIPPTAVVAVAVVDPVPIEITPYACKVPASRNPVAGIPITGDPHISRSRAGRNIGNRASAHIYAELCGVRFGCTQSQSSCQYCCAQHPFA
jgi:hypothetical protein